MDEDWKGEFNKKHLNLKKRQLVSVENSNDEIFKELELESQILETKLDIAPEIEKPAAKPGIFRLALNLTLFKIAVIILGIIFVTICLQKIHVI